MKRAYHMWKQRELARARELAFDVGLNTGAIARLLNHEFGLDLETEQVRSALRGHYGWKGQPRGRPLRGRQAR